jgi:hypothetical protein
MIARTEMNSGLFLSSMIMPNAMVDSHGYAALGR